ncbi:MAG: alanine--tRNA ligase [Patescibacteria group bacterium]|nr:alanine--tRNA ligase [Patescibacteria group bacterium]
MDSFDVRKRFLDFFKKNIHKIAQSSSLLPSDRSVLLTTAGMQQFKEYFLGKISPYGNRVVSCQKCFRTSDIEEVGDDFHLTFLEMLGNFSFGDYFKKDAIKYALEFLVDDLGLEKDKLWVTVFKGIKKPQFISKDLESKEIWQELGIPKERIFEFGAEDNFWGPTGIEGPCGPTSEIHYDLTGKPCKKGKNCVPNCDCGRFVELWNLVFNEYHKDKNGNLSLLKQKGVDTGMGLERLAMVCEKTNSIYKTDLFLPIIQEIEKLSYNKYEKGRKRERKSFKTIADHIRGAVFLAADGIFPSNLDRGYILRRILRRAIRYGEFLKLENGFLTILAKKVIEIYGSVYPELKSKEANILTLFQSEEEKFSKALEKGTREFEKLLEKKKQSNGVKILTGKEAFYLYETYGFPLELTKELAKESDFDVDEKKFKALLKKHQEISRAGVKSKFGGLGKNAEKEAIKLHTATHLLQSALRKVLGEGVRQMGSDITPKRLRFDFSYSNKITEKELKKIEKIVNQKIKEDLIVEREDMKYKEALDKGALAFFNDKYPEKVSVYSIYNVKTKKVFSREICAGPHIKHTRELGCFEIIKEESSGAGIRRIRAILK